MAILSAVAPKPHAVAIPYPAQGHFGPMMQFCIKLATEGFRITFVNTQHTHDAVTQSSGFIQEQGLDIQFVALLESRNTGSTIGVDNVTEAAKAWMKMGDVLSELITKLSEEGSPVTVIVSDLYGSFTQDVANKFGLRRVAFWTASATTIASAMAIRQGFRLPEDESELITWVPGAPPFRIGDFNSFLRRDPKDFMFNEFFTAYCRLGETTWIVMNTFEELEHGALAALREENPHIYTVGPLLPASFINGSIAPRHQTISLWTPEYDCLKWLDSQAAASVLFVSFGSIMVLSQQQFENIVIGLEASEQPLLWVIRSELLLGETTIEFPEGYTERMKGRACFVPWVPQLQVLNHKATGGFLTHAGWNSVLECVTAGLPMLAWPSFGDQMLNKRCAVDGWGTAMEFEAGKDGLVTRTEVEKKVRLLMGGEKAMQMRDRAGKYKAAARKALEEGGSSNLEWVALVESMKTNPISP